MLNIAVSLCLSLTNKAFVNTVPGGQLTFLILRRGAFVGNIFEINSSKLEGRLVKHEPVGEEEERRCHV